MKFRSVTLFMNLFLFLCLSLISRFGQAQDRTGTLTIQTHSLLPTPDIAAHWHSDLFEIPEIWVIENRENFLGVLKRSGLSDQMCHRLEEKIQNGVPQSLYLKAQPFLNFRSQQDVILIDPSLKSQIPNRTLDAVYSYLVAFHHAFPFKKFLGPREGSQFLTRSLNPSYLSEPSTRNSDFRTYKIYSTDYFFYTPEIWPLLSDAAKLEFINQRTEVDSLQVTITFSVKDDLWLIAKKYSGARDPKWLESFLQGHLTQATGQPVTLPLADLLHPFIKDHVNHFSECSGPNCFDSSLSVNVGGDDLQKFITSAQLLVQLSERYRALQPEEAAQTGDVLLYRDANGTAIHAATFITDDIVFTKNGAGKFDPYMFQDRRSMETAYFRGAKFTRAIFRPPGFSQATALPRPIETPHPVLEGAVSDNCEKVLGQSARPIP